MTAVVALALYVVLWALAFAGARSLVEPLIIPLVLVILVAAGVWLQRTLGIEPRKPNFHEPDESPGEERPE